MTDQVEIARLKQGLSIVPISVGAADEALEWAELGMNLGAAAGDLRSRGAGAALFALALVEHGDHDRARAAADEAVRAAAAGGERSIQVIGLAALSGALAAVEPAACAETAQA